MPGTEQLPSARARRVSLRRACAAIALWGGLAAAMNTGVLAARARDVPLPPEATLAVIRATQALDETARRLGLDAPRRWGEAAAAALRGR